MAPEAPAVIFLLFFWAVIIIYALVDISRKEKR